MTTRLFVPTPHEHSELHNLFFFKYAPERLQVNVFNEPPFPNYFESAELVPSLEEADVIVLPNNFTSLSDSARIYIGMWADKAAQQGIPVFVFAFGDFSYEVNFDPRVYVFLISSYKSRLRPHDVLVPTTARSFESIPRVPHKKREKPLVSFCGYAGFKTKIQWLKYLLKNLKWDLAALYSPLLRARKLGIYWRRRAMKVLQRSSYVRTNFIIRRSFSGAVRTIELSPENARKEFIDSIVDSDFVLTPKGDGNYSNRFLETLSLGRIPILIDTDTPLPGENSIPYEKIIVRVPMQEVEKTAEYVRRFYEALTDEEWKERQNLAHQIFETHLKQDVFFRNFFNDNYPNVA